MSAVATGLTFTQHFASQIPELSGLQKRAINCGTRINLVNKSDKEVRVPTVQYAGATLDSALSHPVHNGHDPRDPTPASVRNRERRKSVL